MSRPCAALLLHGARSRHTDEPTCGGRSAALWTLRSATFGHVSDRLSGRLGMVAVDRCGPPQQVAIVRNDGASQ
eukprot:1178057-Prorocentrum_minimum.AAC.5